RSATPFDWMIVRGATIVQSEGRQSMLFYIGDRRTPLVKRHIELAPGRYRLSFAVLGQPEASGAVGFRVHCVAGETELDSGKRTTSVGNGWEKRAYEFTVPSGCPLVRAELTALPWAPAAEAQIDDVVIAHVP
ncbi:MAG: hypothetical protein M3R06_09075, partial [Chloroflexota bacterium]|nr:hypothetical protein [Chloroflexota bacterium]